MRRAFLVLAGLLQLAVVVQFYFAAVGAFAKPQDDKSFALHDLNGSVVIPVLSLLLVVVAALARAPGRMIGFSALPLGLVILQILIVVLGRAFNDAGDHTTPAGLVILGLHAINGLAIMAVVGVLLRKARQLATAPRGTEPESSPAAVA